MEQLVINVGNAPDSGTGDTLYEAFSKVNENFTALFGGPVGSNFFNGSFIALTPTPDDIINGITDFGILLNFSPSYNVTMMYDTSLSWLDPRTNSITTGAFRVQDNSNNLVGIYTNSINTYNNQNLNLLSTGTGIVSVTGTFHYEQQLFNYDNGSIDFGSLSTPIDPDGLVNAQAMIDYVTAFTSIYHTDSIISTQDPNTYVLALGGTTKTVTVVVNNSTSTVFNETGATIGQVVISDNIIQAYTGGTDLILKPGLGGTISVSDARISNVAEPVDVKDAVNLQYLNTRMGNLDILANIDITNLTDGSVIVYNNNTQNFETTDVWDAGTY